MSSTLDLIQAPSREYDDNVLYGSRRYAAKLVELAKSGTTSECVVFSIRCPCRKETWDLKRLIQNDPRIKAMLDGAAITHAMPIQRHAWPILEYSPFPAVFISPLSTGKTYTHLIYIIASVIGAIPIAKTEDLLFSSDPCGASFKLAASPFLKPKENAAEEPELGEIDHDTFDFNSLGREDARNEDQNGWGSKLFEDYEINPDDFINHPKYIIVSSSQQQVETLDQAFDKLKLAAFGRDKISLMRVKNLPPVVKKLNIHHDDEKLALRCNSAEVLLTTPAALIRCLHSKYLTLTKCKKLIFEDLDLTLQLHNFNVREIMKLYLAHQICHDEVDMKHDENSIDKKNLVATGTIREPSDICNLFMFSRKWTVLVKQCVSTVSLQRTLVFGSIAEAAIYANVKFELELYTKNDEIKLELLKKHLRYLNLQEAVAVVCNEEEEAETIHELLTESGYQIYLCKPSGKQSLKRKANHSRSTDQPEKVYVLSDNTLSVLVDCWPHINRMNAIIHYSMPDDILAFDQRFRMMHHHIKEESKHLVTVMFVTSTISTKLAKELYDLLSRSTVTCNSTKLALKDLISDKHSQICWRWASTGLCRLEKLSRNDRFGSYCPDKHSLGPAERSKEPTNRWPKSGQFKITITNLISPSEFYFWFDSYRDKNSERNWTKFNNTGSEAMKELQKELDLLKDIPSCSIPVEKIKQGVVYAIYMQQETRVDRIVLLEKAKVDFPERQFSPANYDKQYSRQVRVFKIDYGIQLDVFLRNIIQLPSHLQNIEFQSHRGVIIGYKPTDGEPNWLYKAKKFFYDQVNVSNLMNITVWLRLNSHSCFWFEDMVVTRLLENMDGFKILKIRPHRELVQAGLATKVTTELSCLPPSDRLLTLSKWHTLESAEYARYAFLRRDKPLLQIFVLDINEKFELGVRAADYNKLLINLEDQITEDYRKNKLEALSYFAKDVYCIAKVSLSSGKSDEKDDKSITLNRCKIIDIYETKLDLDSVDVRESKYLVRCLDHNDEHIVSKSHLFHATPEYLSRLPFQAITCTLANLNQELLKNPSLSLQVRDHIYDFTRDLDEDLVRLLCTLTEEGQLEVYIPVSSESHEPLGDLFKKKYGIDLLTTTVNIS